MAGRVYSSVIPWIGIFQARIPGWATISFLQGIFPTQGSNPHLLHCRFILLLLSNWGSSSSPLIFSNQPVHTQLLPSCPTLCNPMDRSPPGSFVHGILQARILEWVGWLLQGIFPTQGMNPHLPQCRQILCCWATKEAHYSNSTSKPSPFFHPDYHESS